MNNPYSYQFPAFAAEEVEAVDQAAKIYGEAVEVCDAYTRMKVEGTAKARKAFLMEVLDVIHAAETLLRKCDQKEVAAAKAAVIKKNMTRGYYDRGRNG